MTLKYLPYLTVMSTMVTGHVCCPAAEPCLVFSKSELPALHARIQHGETARVWREIQSRADDYATPGSRGFADPDTLDAPVEGARIQVLAHHFGRRLSDWTQALGFAYQLTGEPRYAQHGVRILTTAAERLPASDPRISKSFAGARGDIMRGFAIGLDWLGETMTAEQIRRVEQTGAEYIRTILTEAGHSKTWWVPYHNFMGVSLGAAGCLAIKLNQAYPNEAPKWLSDCAAHITRWLDEGFDDHGAYFEGTGYAHYGLSNAILLAHALQRHNGVDLFDHPHLRQVPHFYVMSLLPGERVFDARNDANYSGLSDPFMLRLATAFDNGLARWLWERCGSGYSPLRIAWMNDVQPVDPGAADETLAEHFLGRGLCVFRTGWDQHDAMIAVEAGRFYPITHNQADKGHFTLYAFGQRWAIDSGYGNNREPGGRDQTVAHNCILIDGEGQALSGAGAGTNGSVLAYQDGPNAGYALCDAAQAYNTNSKKQPGATALRALRHTLFVRPSQDAPAYAVVLDDIQKDDDAHEFTWLLHTASENEVRIEASHVTVVPAATSGGAFVTTPVGATGQGTLEHELSMAEPGSYVVWARVRAVGPESGKSDSFFVQLDDREPVAWHMPGSRKWRWAQVSSGIQHEPVVFALERGQHVLRFLTREPDAQVDRIIVTADTAAEPPFPNQIAGVDLEAESGKVTSPMEVVTETPETAPPRMQLFMWAASQPHYSVDAYDGHPRLKVAVQAVRPEFVAVMVPLPADVPDPHVAFETSDNDLRASIRWPSRHDEIVWPWQGDRRPVLSQHPR